MLMFLSLKCYSL